MASAVARPLAPRPGIEYRSPTAARRVAIPISPLSTASCSAESIYDSCSKGGLRPDNSQIYPVLKRESFQSFNVCVFQRHILGNQPYACIAGSTINLPDLMAAAESIHYSVLAAASSDD